MPPRLFAKHWKLKHICSTYALHHAKHWKRIQYKCCNWFISNLQDVYLGLTFCLTDPCWLSMLFQHSLHIVFSTISYDYDLRQVAVLRFDDSLDCWQSNGTTGDYHHIGLLNSIKHTQLLCTSSSFLAPCQGTCENIQTKMKSFSYLPWGYGYTSRSAEVHNHCTCNMYMSAPQRSDWSNMIVTDRWQSQIRSGRNSLQTYIILKTSYINLFGVPIVSFSFCGCEKLIFQDSNSREMQSVPTWSAQPMQSSNLEERIKHIKRNSPGVDSTDTCSNQNILYHIKHQISSTLNLRVSCYFISMINLCHQLPTPKEFFSRCFFFTAAPWGACCASFSSIQPDRISSSKHLFMRRSM